MFKPQMAEEIMEDKAKVLSMEEMKLTITSQQEYWVNWIGNINIPSDSWMEKHTS